jgi:hypothetical protein
VSVAVACDLVVGDVTADHDCANGSKRSAPIAPPPSTTKRPSGSAEAAARARPAFRGRAAVHALVAGV